MGAILTVVVGTVHVEDVIAIALRDVDHGLAGARRDGDGHRAPLRERHVDRGYTLLKVRCQIFDDLQMIRKFRSREMV